MRIDRRGAPTKQGVDAGAVGTGVSFFYTRSLGPLLLGCAVVIKLILYKVLSIGGM